MAKYGNKKTVVDGITFDSKKEAIRYVELKTLEKGGYIFSLKLQPKFIFKIGGKQMFAYSADFSYIEKGDEIIEDVKSEATRKIAVYRLKKKLIEAQFDVKIREV